MSPTTSSPRRTRKCAARGHLADHRRAGLPAPAELEHRVDAGGLDHGQHPLLRLGDHDLERLHVGLAQRHACDVDVDPDAALRGHLAGRGGEPGRAEVLEGDQEAALDQLEAALEQLRLLERVADLHRRPLLVAVLELGRGEHRGAADPVAARGGAHEHDRVPGAGCGRANRPVGSGEPDAHRVDEAVVLVRRLEVDLAADGRDADRVAVVADPGDDVVEEVARALGLELAEAQRVEHRDRARAEREHVAQDPADAGRGALERLDGARVVVRLDLERNRPAVADRDRARVLARAHQHPLALGRQAPQQLARVLVGAVLGPQQREHRQLDVVGLALQQLDDPFVLGVGEPELAVPGLGDGQRVPVQRITSRSIAAPHVGFQSGQAGASSASGACCDGDDGWLDPQAQRCADPRWRSLALAVPASAGAGVLPTPKPKEAKLTTTGNDSELVTGVPIATTPGANERIAMSLGPDQLEADRGRRPAPGQRRGAGLDHLRRPRPALRRPALRVQPDDHAPGSCSRRHAGAGRRLDPALGAAIGALQAATPEPEPPLHAGDPEPRDVDHRPRGAPVPATPAT